MPGIVLSHPEIQTSASRRCPRVTSSMESATTSRETSDAFMPSVPMAMPSEIAIVFISTGVPPASRIPSFTHSACSRWLKLQGMISIQACATPTSGCLKSSSP